MAFSPQVSFSDKKVAIMNYIPRLPQELVDHIIHYYYADVWLNVYPTAKGIESGANLLRLRQVCRKFDAGVRDALPSLDEMLVFPRGMPPLVKAKLLFSLRDGPSSREHRLVTAIRRTLVLVCSKGNLDVAYTGNQHGEWDTQWNRIGRAACLVVARLVDINPEEAELPATTELDTSLSEVPGVQAERNTEALDTVAHTIAVGTAAHAGEVELLRVLFAQRKYCNTPDVYLFEHPILTAAREGQIDAVRFLHDHNQLSLGDLLDQTGNTPLHCAVVSGNVKVVDFFIHKKEVGTWPSNFDKMTPVELAASLGNEALTKYFVEHIWRKSHEDLQHSNELAEQRARVHLSAMLCTAIFGGQMKVLELIIQFMEGKKLQLLVSGSRYENPIWEAGLQGNLEAAKILMRRQLTGSKSASNELAWLGLIASATAGRIETFEYFLWMEGIHTWIVRAEHRLLALAIAISKLELVQYLVDCYPSKEVFALIEGALYVAVHYTGRRIVSRLAKRRYSSNPVETDFKMTLAAAETKFPEIVAFLDEEGWI
ncbi:uncharacterized protein BDV14DRAFT_168988 [Aspergillus stella-maris]|uniref:uncharacterized protein n=1 Tax=Aspergillus stella-maris TaxID=1810926 RepID=UPI003CCD71CC